MTLNLAIVINGLHTTESDVCRRQILTNKDGPALKGLKMNYISVHFYPFSTGESLFV